MCVNIANLLTENKIENYVVATRSGGKLQKQLQSPGNCYVFNKKNSLDVKTFFKIYKLSRSLKIGTIHAHSSSFFWAVLIKLLIRNIKIIWHDHNGNGSQLSKIQRIEIVLFSYFFDYVICVNENLKNWADQNLKTPIEHILYIKNFSAIEVNPIKHNGDIPQIIHLANFRKEKSHLTLLKALAIVKKNNIDFSCVMAGNRGSKEYMDELKEFIINNNLNKNVTILEPQDNVSKILSSADIGVLCSDFEGMPMTLLEYGLAKLPVICTNVGQCADVLDFGKCGILINAGEYEQLASGIKLLVNKPNKRKDFGEKLYNRISKDFSKKTFLNAYIKIVSN